MHGYSVFASLIHEPSAGSWSSRRLDDRRTMLPPQLPSIHPVSVQGGKVMLREVEYDDAAAAFRWGADAEWFRFLPYESVHTLDEERRFIRGVMATAGAHPRLDYHLAVVLRETVEMIGLVRLQIVARDTGLLNSASGSDVIFGDVASAPKPPGCSLASAFEVSVYTGSLRGIIRTTLVLAASSSAWG